jgi:hypothetical protein
MPSPVAISTHAIVPHNDTAKVLRFRSRLGSGKSGGVAPMPSLKAEDANRTSPRQLPAWSVPARHHPFGAFIRTLDLEVIVR